MSKRSDFVAKKVDVDRVVKSFEITSEYEARQPYRGITEIAELIELTEKHNSFISGGYARYCMSPAHNPIKPVDLDIFSSDQKNHEDIIEAFEEKFSTCDRFKREVLDREPNDHDEGDDEDVGEFWHPSKEETDFAVSYRLDLQAHPGMGMIERIQFIKPSDKRTTAGPLMDILNNFDFTICKVALISPNTGICHNGMDEDEFARILRITGEVKNPIATFARITKYSKKGYNLSPMTLIKVLNAWRDADDHKQVDALEDMAAYQLLCVNESSEIDKEIDFYELGQIKGELASMQNKLHKKDPNYKPKMDAFSDWVEPKPMSKSAKGLVYQEGGRDKSPKKVMLELDKDGQLVLQNKKNYSGWDY